MDPRPLEVQVRCAKRLGLGGPYPDARLRPRPGDARRAGRSGGSREGVAGIVG